MEFFASYVDDCRCASGQLDSAFISRLLFRKLETFLLCGLVSSVMVAALEPVSAPSARKHAARYHS